MKRKEKECFKENGKRYIIIDGKRRILNDGESFRKSDNRFSYRITIDGSVYTSYAKTLDALRIKEDAILKDVSDGINFNKSSLTLNEWHKEVMKTKARRIKPTTLSTQNDFYRLYIENSIIGKKKLADIRTQDLKIFYNSLADESGQSLAYATIAVVHTIISYDLEIAAQNDYIRKNYAHGAIADLPRDQTEKVPMNLEQIHLLLDFCKTSNVYSKNMPLLVFMLETGLRISELAGICWKDIDTEKGTLNVARQVIYRRFPNENEWSFHVLSPKSKSGKRTIVLSESSLNAIESIRKQRQCRPITIDGQVLDLVFRTRAGGVLNASKVNNILSRLEKAYNEQAKEPLPHLSCHVLRHTCLTALARQKVPVKIIQGIAGHSSPQITLSVYDHSDKDISFQRQERQRISICG